MERRLEVSPYSYHKIIIAVGIIFLIFVGVINYRSFCYKLLSAEMVVRLVVIVFMLCYLLSLLIILYKTSKVMLVFQGDGLKYVSNGNVVKFESKDITYAYYYNTMHEIILVLSPCMLDMSYIKRIIFIRIFLWEYWTMILHPQIGQPIIIAFAKQEQTKFKELFELIYKKYGIRP